MTGTPKLTPADQESIRSAIRSFYEVFIAGELIDRFDAALTAPAPEPSGDSLGQALQMWAAAKLASLTQSPVESGADKSSEILMTGGKDRALTNDEVDAFLATQPNRKDGDERLARIKARFAELQAEADHIKAQPVESGDTPDLAKREVGIRLLVASGVPIWQISAQFLLSTIDALRQELRTFDEDCDICQKSTRNGVWCCDLCLDALRQERWSSEQIPTMAAQLSQQRSEIQRLTEALRSAREQGWQDISTAPKDGTRVLVFDASWCGGAVRASVSYWQSYKPNDNAPRGAWAGVTVPTHWQPLPPAPAGETTTGGNR